MEKKAPISRPLVIVATIALLAALGGCKSQTGLNSRYDVYGEQRGNVFGLISAEKGTYDVDHPNSANVSREDISVSQNPTGNKTTLLFGAIELQDY